GHEVEWEDALGALLLTVDGEGDALVDERELLQPLAALDLVLRERLEDGNERPVVLAWRAGLVEGFVECARFGHPFHGAENSISARECHRGAPKDSSLRHSLRTAIRGWMSAVVVVVKDGHGDVGTDLLTWMAAADREAFAVFYDR